MRNLLLHFLFLTINYVTLTVSNPNENRFHHEMDGTLRCYDCFSDRLDPMDVCAIDTWKHANQTQKRNMIMQCPKVLSGFCAMVIYLEEDKVERGCSESHYLDGREAHTGCFTNTTTKVCLCNTELCNASAPLWQSLQIGETLLVLMLFYLITR